VDVYNLILDRGYIGALEYASKIENKNYRLASEIDQIVCELYKTASGVSKNIKTAQSAMPRFETYRAPERPTVTRTAPSQPASSTDFEGRPEGMPESKSALYGMGYGASLYGKLKQAIPPSAFPKILEMIKGISQSGKISADELQVISNLMHTVQDASAVEFLASKIGLDAAQTLKIIETLKQGKTAAEIEALIKGFNLSTKSTGKLSKLTEILVKASEAAGFLQPVVKFIKGASRFLGPLALAFDTYDIFAEYEKEGVSNRVICKITSAILGLSSLLTAAIPAASAILGALWLAASLGCGLIPPKKNEQAKNSYQSLSQSQINQAEATVQKNNLSSNDQNLIDGLFSGDKNRAEIINSVRNLKNNKQFENPVDSLAFIQKQLKQIKAD
jgi:hypothetical protein